MWHPLAKEEHHETSNLSESEHLLANSSHKLQVIPPSTIACENVVENLLHTLKNGSEREFLQQYNSCLMGELSNENQIKLLMEAIAQIPKERAFNAILRNVTDINYSIVFQTANLLNSNGNAILQILNRQDFHSEEPFIHLVGSLLSNERDKEDTFWKGFDELLNKIGNIGDIGCTLLNYAVMFGNKVAIEKLIDRGTYIGYEFNEQKYFAIDHIDLDLLTELFDSCINKSGNSREVIVIDFKNLKPIKKSEESENCLKEMTPIMRIACSKEKQHLLKHPLITSFMTLKWQRISMFFYANVLLYCVYGISMIAYIILKCEGFGFDHLIVKLAYCFSILGIIFLTVREITQMWPLKKHFSKPINYFEIPLIILSIVTIKMDFQTGEKAYVVLTVLLMVVDFCFLVRSLPIQTISTHMLMLGEVLFSFLTSSSLYSILFFTFSLCFYILIGGQNVMDNNKIRNDTDEKNISYVNDTNFRNGTDEKDKSNMHVKNNVTTNSFPNILQSFVKVMAMSVGELDLGNLGLRNAYCDILFLIFVISMTVVLMNLLNGLAVNDIQIIRGRAELNSWICRANVLNTFEDFYFPFSEKIRKDYALLVFCLRCKCSTNIKLTPNSIYYNPTLYPPYCNECTESMNKMNIIFSKILSWSYRQTVRSTEMASIRNDAMIVELKKNKKQQLKIVEDRKENQLRNIEVQTKLIRKQMQLIDKKIQRTLMIVVEMLEK